MFEIMKSYYEAVCKERNISIRVIGILGTPIALLLAIILYSLALICRGVMGRK